MSETKYRFRLLRGRHIGEDGKTYIHNEPRRNIVPSDVELDKRFGSDKFRRLGEEAEVIEDDQDSETEDARKTLMSMKVDELKQHAEAEGIDITGMTKKSDIVEAILSAGDEDA